jgi:integrase
VRTVLGYLRSLGLLPRLSSDALKDSLKRVPVTVELMHYMKPRELRRLLEAALAHDAATFKATRAELAGNGKPGTTRCYTPIAPLVAAATLTGMRFSELVDLDWRQVDLDASGHDGTPVGEIRLTSATKTRRARLVGLEVCPTLRALLDLMHDKRSKGLVFGLKEDEAKAAARRLVAEYDAPDSFNWQALRRTAGTFLTNAPGIYGAASAYHSAKQLGHSVQVAEKHYVGVVRGIPAEAKTLEAAMQIETEMARVVEAERGRDG